MRLQYHLNTRSSGLKTRAHEGAPAQEGRRFSTTVTPPKRCHSSAKLFLMKNSLQFVYRFCFLRFVRVQCAANSFLRCDSAVDSALFSTTVMQSVLKLSLF